MAVTFSYPYWLSLYHWCPSMTRGSRPVLRVWRIVYTLTDSQLGSNPRGFQQSRGQVKLDIHTLESLFGECLRVLTNKRTEVLARYIVRQFIFYTRDMMNCQPELSQVSPPPLQFRFLRWWALLERLHWFLVTERDNRIRSQ